MKSGTKQRQLIAKTQYNIKNIQYKNLSSITMGQLNNNINVLKLNNCAFNFNV